MIWPGRLRPGPGVRPSRVNPRAIQVMAELGIDISHQRAKSVDDLAGEQFDLVITVCDQAQQQCPIFPGETEVMHVGFPDPAQATGTEAEIMAVFRQVRDDLREQLMPLLLKICRSKEDRPRFGKVGRNT